MGRMMGGESRMGAVMEVRMSGNCVGEEYLKEQYSGLGAC